MSEGFYFGCVRRTGHHFYNSSLNGIHTPPSEIPFTRNWKIDGGYLEDSPLTKNKSGPEGRALVVHEEGWTLLTFWDRSVDSRGASNSGFIFENELTFEQALSKARESFPAIFARFKFPIVDAAKESK